MAALQWYDQPGSAAAPLDGRAYRLWWAHDNIMSRQASPPSGESPGTTVRNCSVERTLGIVSDAWTFLVLREFYLGARRFGEIQTALGIPRTTLSVRLHGLVEAEMLVRQPHAHVADRSGYRLTERGLDLYLVMLALLRFGDDHLNGGRDVPLILLHRKCGQVCRPETLCSQCNRPIEALRVSYRDGPGAGRAIETRMPQRRRTGNADMFERGRPSSVSRTLGILADRWTFLLLREFFFGVTRFDDFQSALRIASNILADRLNHLVERGIIKRILYRTAPDRYEYKLTAIGRELYLPLIQMMRWGDGWLSEQPPVILHHKDCDRDFTPVIACDQCREPIHPRDMDYRLNYRSPREPPVAG